MHSSMKQVHVQHRIKTFENNCLRKSEVSVERISVCSVTEQFAEHVIHFLLGAGTKGGICLSQ